jgi:hypothetical protein
MGELEPDHPGEDEGDRKIATEAARVAERPHAEQKCSRRADPGPDRVAVPNAISRCAR